MLVWGEAPVPPIVPADEHHVRVGFGTPAATVPTPTSATNLTLIRAW